jgi:hypothetical protein
MYNNIKYYRMITNVIAYNNNIMVFFYNTETNNIHSDGAEEIDPRIIKNTYLDTLVERLNYNGDLVESSSKYDGKNATPIFLQWCTEVILTISGSYNLIYTHKKISNYIEEYDKINIYNLGESKYKKLDFVEKHNPVLLIIPYYTSRNSSFGSLDRNICKNLLSNIKTYYKLSSTTGKNTVVGGRYSDKYIKYLKKNKYL